MHTWKSWITCFWSRPRRSGPQLLPCGSFPYKVNLSSVLSPQPAPGSHIIEDKTKSAQWGSFESVSSSNPANLNILPKASKEFRSNRLATKQECVNVARYGGQSAIKIIDKVRSDGFNIRLSYHLKIRPSVGGQLEASEWNYGARWRREKAAKIKKKHSFFLTRRTFLDHASLWNRSLLSVFKTDRFLKWSISIYMTSLFFFYLLGTATPSYFLIGCNKVYVHQTRRLTAYYLQQPATSSCNHLVDGCFFILFYVSNTSVSLSWNLKELRFDHWDSFTEEKKKFLLNAWLRLVE